MPDRHKVLECPICKKMMRSNNLKRHWRSKHSMSDMVLTTRVEIKDNTGKDATRNDLKSEILKNSTIFDEKIQLGESIFKVLMETNVDERSLSQKHKEAFDLYQNKRLALNPDNDINLFPWQESLLDLARKPTHREIIWVKGARGNEGKTWFQNYLQSILGTERVVQLDLKSSVGNIMQILKKLPLSSINTFLFNDARSGKSELRCYEVLENIKDGRAIAPKYDSEILRFRTPNSVIVFSNADPDMTQLSKDRWRVFYINKKGLLSVPEQRLLKQKAF